MKLCFSAVLRVNCWRSVITSNSEIFYFAPRCFGIVECNSDIWSVLFSTSQSFRIFIQYILHYNVTYVSLSTFATERPSSRSVNIFENTSQICVGYSLSSVRPSLGNCICVWYDLDQRKLPILENDLSILWQMCSYNITHDHMPYIYS